MPLTTLRIDGAAFHDLEGFYAQVERELLGGTPFGRNLDAFNEILYGGFGPLPEAFALTWVNSALSRQRLGHAETVRQLRARLTQCHPLNRSAVQSELSAAKRGIGPTVFDWLIAIIRAHTNVELILA